MVLKQDGDQTLLTDIGLDRKEMVYNELRNRGYKITKQRKLIIDTILVKECTCCKEILYQIHQRDNSIGIATVYRMIRTLEEIGAIDRKNLYRIAIENNCDRCEKFSMVLKSKKNIELSIDELISALQLGLKEQGILLEDKIESLIIELEDCRKEVYKND